MKSNNLEHVLNILRKSTGFVKASVLADFLNVSNRTIRSYVKELIINGYLIDSSGEGYKLNEPVVSSDLDNKPQIQTNQYRHQIIISEIIKNTQVNVFDLCDQLYISMATLEKDLAKVKKTFGLYDLTIKRVKETLKLIGNEKQKRKLMSDIYLEQFNANYYSIEDLEQHFGYDLKVYRNGLNIVLDKHDMNFNEYTVGNILYHILVTLQRIDEEHFISFASDYSSTINSLTNDIVLLTESTFNTRIPQVEVNYIQILLDSKVTYDYNKESIENIYLEPTLIQTIEELVEDVKIQFLIDLKHIDFTKKFALHVTNLIERSNAGFLAKNPLTSTIKSFSPLVYDLAVFVANELQNKLKIQTNEDEIAYIAMHIGSYLELRQSIINKIGVTLVAPQYYEMHLDLEKKILKRLGDRIYISKFITKLDDLNKIDKNDLVFTIINSNHFIAKNIITISPFLTDDDIVRIEMKINKLIRERKIDSLKSKMFTLFSDDLFIINSEPFHKEQILKLMINNLCKLNIVTPDFYNDVLERESLSSTAFVDMIAVPHSMKMNALKSSISILISDLPIKWDEEKSVRCIVMITMNEDERYMYRDIFDSFVRILTDIDNVTRILQKQSADEIIDLISGLMSF